MKFTFMGQETELDFVLYPNGRTGMIVSGIKGYMGSLTYGSGTKQKDQYVVGIKDHYIDKGIVASLRKNGIIEGKVIDKEEIVVEKQKVSVAYYLLTKEARLKVDEATKDHKSYMQDLKKGS